MLRRSIFPLCALALLLFAGCDRGHKPPAIGGAAPDFTVADGTNRVTLSKYRGQIVVLNFWATWCAPCVEEIPSLVAMQKRLKSQGVVVLAVSTDESDSAYRKFLADHHVDLLTVRDGDEKSSSLYGTFKFPETFVIDGQGVVRRKFIGAVDWTSTEVVEYLTRIGGNTKEAKSASGA